MLPAIHELDLFKSVLVKLFTLSQMSSLIGRLSLTCVLLRCFQSILIHLQMLWELTLLGEPLVIMAPSPTVSSETVLALIRYLSGLVLNELPAAN